MGRTKTIGEVIERLEAKEDPSWLIRCKDCKYAKSLGKKHAYLLCQYYLDERFMDEDDYCSFAERKEE